MDVRIGRDSDRELPIKFHTILVSQTIKVLYTKLLDHGPPQRHQEHLSVCACRVYVLVY